MPDFRRTQAAVAALADYSAPSLLPMKPTRERHPERGRFIHSSLASVAEKEEISTWIPEGAGTRDEPIAPGKHVETCPR